MILNKEELETMAEEVSNKYFPNRGVENITLDPYDLAEKLGVDIEWKYITPNNKILGMIFLDDCLYYVWPHRIVEPGDKPTQELFKKNSIVINQCVLDGKKDRKEENFIVMHELAHMIKDADYITNTDKQKIHMCKNTVFKRAAWYEKTKELECIERQASYLAAALLMPRDLIKNEFYRLLNFKMIPRNSIRYQPYMRQAIEQLTDIFQVDFSHVLYRLYDAEILKAVQH
jgi:Zn-dependent peptidase ImmA (M78 family)